MMNFGEMEGEMGPGSGQGRAGPGVGTRIARSFALLSDIFSLTILYTKFRLLHPCGQKTLGLKKDATSDDAITGTQCTEICTDSKTEIK